MVIKVNIEIEIIDIIKAIQKNSYSFLVLHDIYMRN